MFGRLCLEYVTNTLTFSQPLLTKFITISYYCGFFFLLNLQQHVFLATTTGKLRKNYKRKTKTKPLAYKEKQKLKLYLQQEKFKTFYLAGHPYMSLMSMCVCILCFCFKYFWNTTKDK